MNSKLSWKNLNPFQEKNVIIMSMKIKKSSLSNEEFISRAYKLLDFEDDAILNGCHWNYSLGCSGCPMNQNFYHDELEYDLCDGMSAEEFREFKEFLKNELIKKLIQDNFNIMNKLFNGKNKYKVSLETYSENSRSYGELRVYKNGSCVIAINIGHHSMVEDFEYYKNSPEIIAYDFHLTLIHEFTHLQVKNHSKKFYKYFRKNLCRWLGYNFGKTATYIKHNEKEKKILKMCINREKNMTN